MKNNVWKSRLVVAVLFLCLLMSCCATAIADNQSNDVTLSIVSYRALQTNPVPWYETDVYKYILQRVEEEYGWKISIDYSYYDTDKLNLMFASGELPDIVYFSSPNQVQTVLENDYALDLKPLLEEYAPNMLDEQFAQRNALMCSLAGGENNGLYFVPQRYGVEYERGGTESNRGYGIRWDWYKEIGAPEISDDASYIDALAAIVEKHPTTDDGKPVYAYGYYDDFSQWTQWRSAFTYETLVNPWTVSGYLYSEGLDDNVLYNGYTNTERSTYWQEMRFANNLYKRGLLDPDSFTQTLAEYTTKESAGQYAGILGTSNSVYKEELKKDPNTIAGYVVVPSEGAMFYANKIHLAGYFPDQQVFISSSSKNWEAALALIDFLHTDEAQRALYSGIEGVHWNYDENGVPTLTEETIAARINSGETEQLSGVGVNTAIRISQPAVLAADGYPLSLFETDTMRARSLTNYQKDFSEYYGVSYPSEARQRLVDEGKIINHSHNYSQLVAVAREAMPTNIMRTLTKCNDILYRAIPELVMAEDDAAFESIQNRVMEELAAVNEAEAWDWVSQAQAAAHKLVDPIIKSE